MADAKKSLTREEVEKIANKIYEKKMGNLEEKIDTLNFSLQAQGSDIARITRLLLGEEGITQETEALAHRARFAHEFASENKVLMTRMKDVVTWFDKWDKPQAGCELSNLKKLGRLLRLYDNISWLLGLIGVATVFNAIPVIQWIIDKLF